MISSTSQRLGILSVPVLGILAIAFGVLDLAEGLTFESAILEALVNIFVIFSVSMVIVRLSAKSFLLTGSTNLLLLGLAVFEFSCFGIIGGFLTSFSVTQGIEMYLLGALLSSPLHLASGIMTYRGSPIRKTRLGLRILVSYALTILVISICTVVVVTSSLFSSIAEIGSLTDRALVATVAGILLLSTFLFSRVYSRSHNPILYWYSLALATISFAFIAFFTTQENGDPATWTGIGGLCLASIYFLKSVNASPMTSGISGGLGPN